MEKEQNTQNNTADDISLETKIESLLFYHGEPVVVSKIAKTLKVSVDEIETELVTLEKNLKERGVNLSRKEDEVALVTNKAMSELITNLRKEDLSKDLSKAAMETLSIVIYRGPIKRAEIDYIRGVNSQFILRLLLIRGLIEKVTNPQDERGYLYKPSFDLLNYLGINKIDEIPEYQSTNEMIENFINTKDDDNEE
jgi:segregation and condensation protein B